MYYTQVELGQGCRTGCPLPYETVQRLKARSCDPEGKRARGLPVGKGLTCLDDATQPTGGVSTAELQRAAVRWGLITIRLYLLPDQQMLGIVSGFMQSRQALDG